MYKVSFQGSEIGYTEDKRELQNKINNYIEKGDSKTVAFVDVEDKPEYTMCLIKKGLVANDNEIFNIIISSGTPYYKYYAIMENGEEKYYVSSYAECEEVIAELKNKDSKNQDDVTYSLKYEPELKDFTDTATIVSALYVKKPVVKKTSKISTSTTINYSKVNLGISLIRPVNGSITSRFGASSYRRSSRHTGLDIANSKGTPIKAAAAGTVSYASWKGSYGNLIVIDHGGGIQTYYGHLSSIGVSVGQSVGQGQVIAAMGSTGNSTGPHLHFEIRTGGVALNPQNYLY